MAHILFLSLILMVGYLSPVHAVTDAELEALEKQIEQQEAEEKKQAETAKKKKAEAEAKQKAEQKRKAEAETKRKAEAKEERIAEKERMRKKELTLTGEMVNIPAGSFRMGDINGDYFNKSENPVHTVTIASFRMGKHEVTFDQWDACVTGGGCNGYSPEDKGWGRGKQPVIKVSWEDAQSFVKWLNGKTGGGYRLPSEAEWEYAARAGTLTEYPWGNDIGHNHANCKGCGSQWDNKQSAPSGSFPANVFGLHDMHGNVWEWTQDCAHEEDGYSGAPSDGSVWTGGDCSLRVFRGGSWNANPGHVRSAYRYWFITTYRSIDQGFRLAQD